MIISSVKAFLWLFSENQKCRDRKRENLCVCVWTLGVKTSMGSGVCIQEICLKTILENQTTSGPRLASYSVASKLSQLQTQSTSVKCAECLAIVQSEALTDPYKHNTSMQSTICSVIIQPEDPLLGPSQTQYTSSIICTECSAVTQPQGQ